MGAFSRLHAWDGSVLGPCRQVDARSWNIIMSHSWLLKSAIVRE